MFHAPVRANGGRQKGAAGVFAAWLARKKNYLSLAHPASGAIQRVRRAFTAMGTRNKHEA